jgi:RecA-family ATPase
MRASQKLLKEEILAKMQTNQERMNAKTDAIQEKMEATTDGNNQKYKALPSTLISQINIHQVRAEDVQE